MRLLAQNVRSLFTVNHMTDTHAWGIGLATITDSGTVLDTWYPSPHIGTSREDADKDLKKSLEKLAGADPARQVSTRVICVEIDLDEAPEGTSDAYLRLHILSHRLRRPGTINLDNIFAHLPNVVWTSDGPCAPEGFEETRMRLRASLGHFPQIQSIDKFPPMVNYVVPSGVRIGEGARVRLGAHLAEGTTVMHAAFVNFNAGTLGNSMVEGRISQGVIIDEGSDVGGGASMMGTLSGGGRQKVRMGKGCLLGANSGLGIPLGDNCVVEAGLYITAGTKVTVLGEEERTVSARDLAGESNILFRRNSVTGRVEVLPWKGRGVVLNTALHKN